MSNLQPHRPSYKIEPPERAVDALVRCLRRVVAESVAANATFGEREAAALAVTNEAVRRMLEADLQHIADEALDEILVDGARYRRHQPGTGRYYSLCGELRVTRWTYRLRGVRNGPTEIPLERAAGLIAGTTNALAFAVTHGYARSPIRWVEAELHAAHRRPPSLATLDRVAKTIGLHAKERTEAIEPRVRDAESVPAEAVAINLGLDRTTIPMEEEPEEGDPDRKCSVRYRMGYVGTFCLTDADARPLCTRRYAVPAHQGPDSLIRRMLADARHALIAKPDLHVGVVQDNAPELWNRMRDALQADSALSRHGWRETVDWYHLMEYFGRVLAVLVPDEVARERILARWRRRLERNDRGIDAIDRWICRRGFRTNDKKTRAAFIKVHGIYLSYRAHFRYASLRAYGLHRGSGVTEGACKSLIAMRAKRSGQRWRREGIDAVLALKSLLDSERLPAFWELFALEHQAPRAA